MISVMRIPDVESNASHKDEGACNKIKKDVNKKTLKVKYQKLSSSRSGEEIYRSSMNNKENIDEIDEQNTRTIKGDVNGKNPFPKENKTNELFTVSKPQSIKNLKTEAGNSKMDGKFETYFMRAFSGIDQNERVPSKKMKNHNQKKKMENKKKNQGKELTINSFKRSREDVRSLVAETETKDSEMKKSSAGIEKNKSTSNATVSQLVRNIRLPITPRKDCNTILGKETHYNNQNASVEVQIEIFSESQTKKENFIPNIHQKKMGTYENEWIVNDGECKEDKSRDPNIICSYERQNTNKNDKEIKMKPSSAEIENYKSMCNATVSKLTRNICLDITPRKDYNTILRKGTHNTNKNDKHNGIKLISEGIENDKSTSNATVLKLRRSIRFSLTPRKDCNAILRKETKNTNQKDKDNEMKPSSAEIENDKSMCNITVSKLRRSIRLALTPRKNYNANLRKETKNTNQKDKDNEMKPSSAEIENDKSMCSARVSKLRRSIRLALTPRKDYNAILRKLAQNTNQKDKDDEMKPPSIENDKSMSHATVLNLRRSIRLALTPRKNYNAIPRKGTQNTNQNTSFKAKMLIFNESQTKEENLVSIINQKNMGTYDKKCTVNDGDGKEDVSSDPSRVCSYELRKVTLEKRKSMVTDKVNSNKSGSKRKEIKIKNERGSCLRMSSRISLLPRVNYREKY